MYEAHKRPLQARNLLHSGVTGRDRAPEITDLLQSIAESWGDCNKPSAWIGEMSKDAEGLKKIRISIRAEFGKTLDAMCSRFNA
jgi:hypothetical protein